MPRRVGWVGAAVSIALVGSGCGKDDGPRDSTPPAVVATTPVADAVDVDPNTPIAVFFSEEMDAASVNVASFALVDGVERLPCSVTASGPAAALTAATPLRPNTRYTEVVLTSASYRGPAGSVS